VEVSGKVTDIPVAAVIPPTPTPAAWAQVMATAKANPPVFGPYSGSLAHEEDDFVELKRAKLDLCDFVVEAVFYNPYPTTKGSWDIGFLFRDGGGNEQFRLTVVSDGDWILRDNRSDESNIIKQGRLSNLDVRAGGSNRLTLVAEGDQGFFFVNDIFIAELDLSSRTNSGDISVATGITSGHEIGGEVTAYEDFTIWSLTAAAPPPTRTATPVPVKPPIVVAPGPDTNLAEYESIIGMVDNWEGPKKPGHYKWQVQFLAGKDVLVSLAWCTADRQTLEGNWLHMSYHLMIDGQVIDLEDLSTEWEGSDRVCRGYSGLAKGWERGPHSYVWTHSIYQPIHDGWDLYPAGDYVMEFEIDVY